MKPEVGAILGLSARSIAMGPDDQGAAFAMGTTGLITALLGFAAGEYERGADIRFTENAEMRALFAELAPQVTDAALKAKLEEAAKGKDGSLRISALNENNYALRRQLTLLQTHVEEIGARTAERRIWAVLKEIATRRLVPVSA